MPIPSFKKFQLNIIGSYSREEIDDGWIHSYSHIKNRLIPYLQEVGQFYYVTYILKEIEI